MASSAKKKTTFAKLNRETKLRERRMAKQARKDARKQEAAERRDAPADVEPVEVEADAEADAAGGDASAAAG